MLLELVFFGPHPLFRVEYQLKLFRYVTHKKVRTLLHFSEIFYFHQRVSCTAKTAWRANKICPNIIHQERNQDFVKGGA